MIAAALPAGRAVWTWLGENPNNVSGAAFVEFFQALDRGVAVPMAFAGFSSVVLTATSAFLCRSDRVALYLYHRSMPVQRRECVRDDRDATAD
jgi:hypothetical protein